MTAKSNRLRRLGPAVNCGAASVLPRWIAAPAHSSGIMFPRAVVHVVMSIFRPWMVARPALDRWP